MATIGEIQQVANYQGNSNLGGGNIGVANIDLQPLQRLADFTYLRNKENYLEQKKQFSEAVAQASKDLSVDWSKIIPDHREDLFKEREALKSFAREHPDAWSQNSKYFGQLQEKKNQFLEKINGAIGRGIEYEVGKEQIRKNALGGNDVSKFQSALDGSVKGIFDKIDPFADFQMKPVDLSAGLGTFERASPTANYIETKSGTFQNMAQTWQLAQQVPVGDDLRVEENKVGVLKGMTDDFNAIIGDAKNNKSLVITNPDGTILFTPAAKSPSSPIAPFLKIADAFNMDTRKYNALHPDEPVPEIDVTNGIDPTEMNAMIVYQKSVAKNGATKTETGLTYTGDQTKKDLEAMQQAGADRRAKWDNEAQVKAAALKNDKTAQQVLTDATTFADRIYGQIEAGRVPIGDGKEVKGAISVNALSDEEKQVLGIIKYNNDGTVSNNYSSGKDDELFLYIGPSGGIALASRVDGKFVTKTSYSKESLKSARISWAIKQGAGKEAGQYGELNPNGLPPPASSSSSSSTTTTTISAEQAKQLQQKYDY